MRRSDFRLQARAFQQGSNKRGWAACWCWAMGSWINGGRWAVSSQIAMDFLSRFQAISGDFPFSMTRLPLKRFSTLYMKNLHTSYTVYKNPKTKKPKEIKA
jgi:hypothetical protein